MVYWKILIRILFFQNTDTIAVAPISIRNSMWNVLNSMIKQSHCMQAVIVVSSSRDKNLKCCFAVGGEQVTKQHKLYICFFILNKLNISSIRVCRLVYAISVVELNLNSTPVVRFVFQNFVKCWFFVVDFFSQLTTNIADCNLI